MDSVYSERLVTPPADEPITLDEAKAQVRQVLDADNALLEDLITAARERVEFLTGRALLPQTWELVLESFPADGVIELPRAPFRAAPAPTVKYYDTAGAETVLATTTYQVDTSGLLARLVLGSGKSWPTVTLRSAEGVIVRYDAGYTDADAIPRGIKVLLKAILARFYENREALVESGNQEDSQGIQALAAQYRVAVGV